MVRLSAMSSRFDLFLDRWSKIAGILLPIVVGIVGAVYTVRKDDADKAAKTLADGQQTAQAQYANLVALLPLMTSDDDRKVEIGLTMYQLAAANGQAPPNMGPLFEKIRVRWPQLKVQAQAAAQDASVQAGAGCKPFSSALYIQVANDKAQLANGQKLANSLKEASGLPPVQGVQRVDTVPQQTQLRYYFSDANDKNASNIIAALQQLGFTNVAKQNLSPLYLKERQCPPPPTFELWIGSANALDAQGRPHAATNPSGL